MKQIKPVDETGMFVLRKQRDQRINRIIKAIVAIIVVCLLLYMVRPASRVLHIQEIHALRITRITYDMDAKPMFQPEHETIYLDDKAAIDDFASIWKGQFLVLLAPSNVAQGYSVSSQSVNYLIDVLYEHETKQIQLFDNYGNPINMNGRMMWFGFLRSKADIYQEISFLFEENK